MEVAWIFFIHDSFVEHFWGLLSRGPVGITPCDQNNGLQGVVLLRGGSGQLHLVCQRGLSEEMALELNFPMWIKWGARAFQDVTTWGKVWYIEKS